MRRITGLALGVALVASAGVVAAAPAVERIVVAERVDGETREPEGVAEEFPPDVGSVVCFTRITGTAEPTTIAHVWKLEGREQARVELNVEGSPWRTWSTKKIPPEWAGAWTVDVVDAEGNILGTVAFTVRAKGEGD